MERSIGVKLALVGLGFGLAFMLTAAECRAGYDFQFTTQDYALEAPYGGQCDFKTVVQNTGTVADTIDFGIAKNLPAGWSGDFCLRGRCYNTHASILFAVGQSDTIDIEMFVAGVQAMGMETLTGTMRHAPSVTHSETYAGFDETPSIMIVDDDGGLAYETYMVNALQAAGFFARVWDASVLGRPGAVQLKSYRCVLWTTASGDATYLTSADESDMAAFLAAGGRLCLASAGFLSSRMGPSPFITNYLHISSWTNDTGGSPVVGVAADPISDGMSLNLSGGPFPTSGSDDMVLGGVADAIFSVVGTKGLKASESGHKVVFLSFPFEDVSTSDADPNNQSTLVARIIQWFGLPLAGVDVNPARDEGLVLHQNSPNPFKSATTISFSIRGGAGQARLAIYNIEGEVVRTLVSGAVGGSETSVVWDGRDSRGASVAPGLYFCELAAGGASILTKMVVVK